MTADPSRCTPALAAPSAGLPGALLPGTAPAPVPGAVPRIAMVAGEASGDLLSALLLHGLQQRWGAVQASGIGGPQMVAAGFEALYSSDRLAVHGYSLQVLLRVGELLRTRARLRRHLLHHRPDVFIGVDAPDFNLALERDLRSAGIATVHFVCPSIWAWRPERIHRIRQSADHVLCLFPFEPSLLERAGIAATYVGHPLAQRIPRVPDRSGARRALGLPDDGPVLALLPGSRVSEIQYIAPPFLAATALLVQRMPGLRIVLPAAPGMHDRLAALIARQGLSGRVQLLTGQSHTALAACDCTLIASGTATLEAALFKRPMVIAYHMHPWSWRLMQRKQLQPWVGLPNILSQDFIVPELLQDRATPAALADAVHAWLESSAPAQARRQRLDAQLHALHASLHRDTAALAAQAIAAVLPRR